MICVAYRAKDPHGESEDLDTLPEPHGGRFKPGPGISVVAADSYAKGRGRMLIKAMALLTSVDDTSAQVSQSAFGRCVAELTMTPTFFLDREYVRCTQTANNQVHCSIADGACSTEADLVINEDGSLDRIVVMRYFDRGGGGATLERFTGKLSQPKSYAGLALGSKMDGFWNLPEGDLHYVSFDVDSVCFD